MSYITKELLRKRAEHNEMMLGNLEEVALHQEEIVKIENLDLFCRHLKILLLQNNIIEKMENLYKLKELEYLNLALNSIKCIEGIEQCESLQKLDLTVNFIDLRHLDASIECLSKCHIKDLYLTGNPCTDWADYRDYVIAQVDSLHQLDGKDITHSDRIKAKHRLDQLKKDLVYKIEEEIIKEEQKVHEEEIRKQTGDDKIPYTADTRKEMYMQSHQEKIDKDKRQNPDKYVVKEPTPMFLKDGKVRQCDEGGYRPNLNQWDDPENVILTMNIPKFLDTSQIEISLNPTYVSIRIKGKLTQLRLDEEILVSKSTIQRSEVTGQLLITMPKVKVNEVIKKIQENKQKEQVKETKQSQQQLLVSKKAQNEALELLIQKVEAKATQFAQDDDIPDLE